MLIERQPVENRGTDRKNSDSEIIKALRPVFGTYVETPVF